MDQVFSGQPFAAGANLDINLRSDSLPNNGDHSMDASSYGGAFDGLMHLFVFAVCLIPLGLWKLVEIVIWICKHVHIGLN